MSGPILAKPSLLYSLTSRQYIVTTAAFVSLLFILFTFQSYPSVSLKRFGKSYPSRKYDISSKRQASLQPILNSTLGFEKIFAINLPSRTDHHDWLVLAGAVSNITIDFIDGVDGKSLDRKIMPPIIKDDVLNYPGALGAWRAHMNAMSQVVQNGWGSALIMEDDVDWDIRIRRQLQDFALGTDFVSRHWDDGILTTADIHHSNVPKTSPYGDDWDVLWFGHCGMGLAEGGSLVMFQNDDTTPTPEQLITWDGGENRILKQYPVHSRLVTRQFGGTCSLAYAVSQQGARKLLYELGLVKLDGAFDLMLRDFCEGKNGRPQHKCITVLPQIIDQYRPAGSTGGDSDVGDPVANPKIREKALSHNIRWSVRLNMEKILVGDENYDDQYPDLPNP